MVASPAAAAIAADLLWCLGLGVCLAAVRNAAGMLFGNGRLAAFLWDVLTAALAAVLLCGFCAARSASGIARWYMAAGIAAGMLAWHTALAPALDAAAAFVRGLCVLPFRILWQKVLRPSINRAKDTMKSISALHAEKRKKDEKKSKKGKKQLQNRHKILYN